MIGSPRGRRALLAALVVLGLAPRGRGDGAGFVDVLPAGQERLFAEMLGEGAALPGGCAFDGAALDRTFVRARYRCAAGSVEIELRHPGDAAAAGAKRTTREFAIVARGDAPPSLLDGIEERVRGRERAFHWASAEAAGVGTVAADGGAGGSDTAALDEPQAARYRDALVLYRAGKVREALAALVALARENPHGGVLGTLLAALASSAPDGAELSSLVAAADAHPGDPVAQLLAGAASLDYGHRERRSPEARRARYEAALRYLARTRPAFDFEPRVLGRLALAHHRLGHAAEARALVDQALRLDEREPSLLEMHAEVYRTIDRDRAVRDLEASLGLLEALRRQGVATDAASEARTRRLLESVRAASATAEDPFDPPPKPVEAQPPVAAAVPLAKPKGGGAWGAGVVLLAALALPLAGWLALGRRKRRRGTPNMRA